MDIEPTAPTTKNPAAQFAREVRLDPIALPHESDQTMYVATVRFAWGHGQPGTPTNTASICASPRV
ncbi:MULTISPECIES: hypothetical protein [Micrococcaceae]|uniref:hypothetical protein n=1 Tax=Micrococcaceae TaxID=1268 RepID=UPI000A5C5A57|nr:hypothetical protein [Arthrobacter sp. Soil761]